MFRKIIKTAKQNAINEKIFRTFGTNKKICNKHTRKPTMPKTAESCPKTSKTCVYVWWCAVRSAPPSPPAPPPPPSLPPPPPPPQTSTPHYRGGGGGGEEGRVKQCNLSFLLEQSPVQSPMHNVYMWPKVLVCRVKEALACLAVYTSARTVTP